MISRDQILRARWQRDGVDRKIGGKRYVVHECEDFPGLGMAFAWGDEIPRTEWLFEGAIVPGGLAGAVQKLNEGRLL